MNYFEEDYITIDVEESVGIMEWLGLAKTDEYREGMNQFLDMVKEHKPSLWLFNYAQGKVIDVKDQKWTTDEWLEDVEEVAGDDLKKVAVISSKDVFNKVAVRMIVTKLSAALDIDVAYFEDIDEAMEWLQTGEVAEEVEED